MLWKVGKMRKKIFAILLSLTALLGIPVLTAPAALADQYNYVDCWGYRYNSGLDFNRPGGGNITFAWFNISGSTPMEWRVRWFAPNGTSVIWDSGYVGVDYNNPRWGWPNKTVWIPGSTSTVLINAGKSLDGHASCEMWYAIPAP